MEEESRDMAEKTSDTTLQDLDELTKEYHIAKEASEKAEERYKKARKAWEIAIKGCAKEVRSQYYGERR